jgi:uncharacterized protein (DUF433 family)
MEETKSYVEKRGEGYYIAGSRVSLDSVVAAYWRGQPPESILRSYPLLALAQIYGAIAFYLSNQAEIDLYLDEWSVRTAEQRLEAGHAHPQLHAELQAARRETPATRS